MVPSIMARVQAHKVLHPLPTTTHYPPNPPPPLPAPSSIERNPLICNYYLTSKILLDLKTSSLARSLRDLMH